MKSFTRAPIERASPVPTNAVVACRILWRELSHFAARSRNAFHLVYLEQGLHDTPDLLREELQRAIDAIDGRFPAILVGYGLCSNGIAGVSAKRSRLVVPRAHDCITLWLGSKERYRAYFDAHPGTYWYNEGWIETGTQPSQERYERLLAHYAETYGEDNAEYLMEMEQGWFKEYRNAAFIHQGLVDETEAERFSKEAADWLGWTYDAVDGDNSLIEDFLEGRWDEARFLVLEPGETLEPSHDESIVRKAPNLQSAD